MLWRVPKIYQVVRESSLRIALLCVLASLSAGTAVATDDVRPIGPSGEEAVLGTFHLGGPGDQTDSSDHDPRSRLPDDALAPEFSGLGTKALLQLFADARAAMQNGNRDRAQSLYERVIAARPNSRLADEARRDLGMLYRDTGVAARDDGRRNRGPTTPAHTSTAKRGGPLTNTDRSRPQESTRAEPNRRDVPVDQPRRQGRRLVMLERQFIAEVGDRVFFARGSAQLGARAKHVVREQAAWLQAHPDIVVSIQGHADDGSTPDNEQYKLSLARAEAVRQSLIESGVRSSRVATEGLGRTRPVAQCSDSACSAQNRRVVSVISDGPVRTARDTNRRDGRPVPDSQTGSSGRLPQGAAAPPPIRAVR